MQANRYPDRDALALRDSLAAYLMHDTGVSLDSSQVWAGNGSNEVLQQILQVFGGPGRTALALTPGYPMYEEYCRTTFTQLHSLARTDEFEVDLDRTIATIRTLQPNLILLTSPNNPTGTALTIAEIQSVLDEAPGMVVVAAP